MFLSAEFRKLKFKSISTKAMLIELDNRFDYGEDRSLGIGFFGLGIAVVVWTERRNNVIRIISARRANRHEQKRLEQYLSY
jgi:uncharacterized protein